MKNPFDRTVKRMALKKKLLTEYTIISVGCDIGSFQCILFEKAIKLLNDGVNPYEVKKWVDIIEKTWNKFA